MNCYTSIMPYFYVQQYRSIKIWPLSGYFCWCEIRLTISYSNINIIAKKLVSKIKIYFLKTEIIFLEIQIFNLTCSMNLYKFV